MSPHEAGFTELGLFIETSLLGSKFEAGELLEEKPEMDMVTLQGDHCAGRMDGQTDAIFKFGDLIDSITVKGMLQH